MTCLIGICGATGTGKSTVCKKLASENEDYRHLALDNFFRGKSSYKIALGYANMEQPGCTDFNAVFLALYNLKSGRSVTIPKFSKTQDTVIGEQVIEHGNIVLVEGYHYFYDQKIRDIFDLKIYLAADEQVIKKRRQERDKECTDEYFYSIILPEYREHSKVYEDAANAKIDANRSVEEVANDVKNNIDRYISSVKLFSTSWE